MSTKKMTIAVHVEYDDGFIDKEDLLAHIQDLGSKLHGVFVHSQSLTNVGKVISDFYCNGYFGRRYDLEGAVIIHETELSITIQNADGSVDSTNFDSVDNKNELLQAWVGADAE